VLIARVHKLVPKSVWSKRYAHINEFERLLADSDVKILKFFLHISKERTEETTRTAARRSQQAMEGESGRFRRAQALGPVHERVRGRLEQMQREWAPWYIIPANQKWLRNCAISQIIVEALESMDMKYPKIHIRPSQYRD